MCVTRPRIRCWKKFVYYMWLSALCSGQADGAFSAYSTRGLKGENLRLSSARTLASTVFSSHHIGIIIVAYSLTSQPPSPLLTRFLATSQGCLVHKLVC